MDDVGRAKGVSTRVLQPRSFVGGKDDLRVRGPAPQPILKRNELRLVVKVDVEEGVVTGFGVAELFQRPEFDVCDAWKLPMEVIDAGTRVPNDRNAVHLRALRVTCAV